MRIKETSIIKTHTDHSLLASGSFIFLPADALTPNSGAFPGRIRTTKQLPEHADQRTTTSNLMAPNFRCVKLSTDRAGDLFHQLQGVLCAKIWHSVFPTVPAALQGPGRLIVVGTRARVAKNTRARCPSFIITPALEVDCKVLLSVKGKA